MLLLGFYFLLRPGEYAYTDNPDAAPFRLCDVHLLIHNRRIHYAQATPQELTRVNYVALEFTTQKNGVRGELVGLGLSGHPVWCPVKTLVRRVSHLKSFNAPPTTPIYSYFRQRWQRIDTSLLTTYLRNAVTPWATDMAFSLTKSPYGPCERRALWLSYAPEWTRT